MHQPRGRAIERDHQCENREAGGIIPWLINNFVHRNLAKTSKVFFTNVEMSD